MRNRWSTILLVAVVSIMMGALVVMSFLGKPVADDMGFMRDAESGFGQAVLGRWEKDSGRVGQYLTIFLSYRFFGAKAVNIMPILSVLLISCLAAYLIFQLRLQSRKTICCLLGLLFALVGAFTVPSFFDSVLWYDSSACYLMSVSAVLAVLNLIVLERRKRLNIWVKALGALLILFFATFSELATASMLVAAGCGFIYFIVKKQYGGARTIALVVAMLISGLALVYFSPGAINRRATWGATGPLSLEHLLIDSLKHYSTILQGWSIWKIFALLGLVVTFAYFTEFKKNKNIWWVAIIVFISSTYVEFVVANFAGQYMPYRMMTLPSFGLVSCLLIAGLGLSKGIAGEATMRFAAIGASVTLTIAMMGFLVESTYAVDSLVLRKRLVNMRDGLFWSQLSTGEDDIEIISAPVLWFNHDATDLSSEDGELNFVGREYQKLAGEEKTITVVGAPEWYTWGVTE